MMHRTVALQMDPIESINILNDSTFVLALEAQLRKYHILYYNPDDMFYKNGQVFAKVHPISLYDDLNNHYHIGKEKIIDLAQETDVILMRQDPPFNMHYITATHLLEKIHPKTFVVNNPVNVRNAPEKLFVTRFSKFMPPTIITRSYSEIFKFRKEYQDIIIKPLYENGGAGIFYLTEKDNNINALLEVIFNNSREPLIVQAYIPGVRQGDKRIVLVDGKVSGAINRIPLQNEVRSNIHTGGTVTKSFLTDREKEICDCIGPELKKRDLIFVGIDIIDGYLTEINVTSPTGLKEINQLNSGKKNIASLIWDAIEKRLI